jgi:hypothetical protein
VPATLITADWLNSTQEEIVQTILSRGIALSKDTTQLAQTLRDATLQGEYLRPFIAVIDSKDQDRAIKIPDLKFDNNKIKAAYFLIYCEIKTKNALINEVNEAAAIYTWNKSKEKMTWEISSSSILETSGIISLSIDEGGQVFYKHRNVDPDGFQLEIRVSNIRHI